MFKKYAKTVFFISFMLCLNEQSMAQMPLQDSLKSQFKVYQEQNLQEKTFLHTDKEVYLVGEICWFKVYTVDAFFHKPSDMSKVVYVEVLNRNNKAVLQAKIEMKGGLGNGSFLLSNAIHSGNYKLRAYTQWMKNFNTDYFFEKTLTIINTKEVFEKDSLPKEDKYTTSFFPEGGNLVNGIESKVAFQVVDGFGKGLPCEGIVFNDKNDTVARFTPLQFGIGNFVLTPKINENYKAVITFQNGKKIMQVLPKGYESGFVMHLTEGDNNLIKITVRASADKALSTVYLFAHTRGATKAVLSGNIQNGLATFLIDKNKIGDGVSHFTVLNADRQPVCERLYFKYPMQQLQLGLALDAQNYGLRKKIDVQISSNETEGIPTAANMSLAVYRLDSLQGVSEMNIENYLLLCSDMVGKIENPDYYFKNNTIETPEATDNLMLTHGWRRFKWENIFEQKKPIFEFTPEYVGHDISGRVINADTKQAGVKIEGFLSVPSTQTRFYTARSKENGSIKFNLKPFYGKNKIIAQCKSDRDGLYDIEIDNPFSEKYTASAIPTFSIPLLNAASLKNENIYTQVQKAYNGKNIRQFIAQKIDTSTFYLKPDDVYLLDNYVRFTSMEEVLSEYVKPVGVSKKNNDFHLVVWDVLKNKFFDSDPIVLLDGVPIFDLNKFMRYDPLKIRKLEVVSRMYYLGDLSFSGVVNFITYSGNLPEFELDPHTTVLDYEGLQLQRTFYAPTYETDVQTTSRLPDYRNLLYWSPDINTNKSGKTNLTFYTSDLPGKYAMILQGINADGKAGSSITYFEVKETNK